jgi:hypothetical protein
MLPGLQTMALDQSGLQGGQNYLNNVLSGQYLGQDNPYLNQMIGQTDQNVGNQVNAQFSAAGRTGGGANQYMLTKGLADAENGLRYQNYSNERQAQTQAAGLLPALQTARFSGISPLLSAYQTAGQLPYYGANAESGIGSLFGGFSNSTTHQNDGSGGALGDIASAAISVLPFIPGISDRRLKTNIRKVGEAKDGLGIYDWNWKADPNGKTERGVIADEVEKLRPWAFVPNFIGEYAGVNYGALGSLA